ncbi:DinB family protein [Telluribacter humicola]|uniref:DinB family protein n=1 Tax=Telluribacter humicola TaxID=1720261 RepID=UPI001A974F15|nr:DinB family protein [Telluribacter humicola]
MKEVINKIEQTVRQSLPALRAIPEEKLGFKDSPLKWSRKETIGHLVDSAQNNIQRFVRSQYETTPRIIYNQDEWVRLQDYEHYPTEELLQLWEGLNNHLCRVLRAMPPDHYFKTCNIGKDLAEEHTLLFLAEDYLAHMEHHLRQLVE